MKNFFNLNTILKIVIIFLFGFLTRAIFGHLLGVNVFIDFLNGLSVLYYMWLAGFTVFVNDFLDIESLLQYFSGMLNSLRRIIIDLIYRFVSILPQGVCDIYKKSISYVYGCLSKLIRGITGFVNMVCTIWRSFNNLGKLTINSAKDASFEPKTKHKLSNVSLSSNDSSGSNSLSGNRGTVSSNPSSSGLSGNRGNTGLNVGIKEESPDTKPVIKEESPDIKPVIPVAAPELDSSSYSSLGESLISKCEYIAANKPASHSGNVSVNLKEAGIKKGSAEFAMIERAVNTFPFSYRTNTSTSLAGKGWAQTTIYTKVTNPAYSGSNSFGGGTILLDHIKNFRG